MKLLDKHMQLKTLNKNLIILRTPMTPSVLITTWTLHQTQNDYHELMKSLRQNKAI